MFDAIKPRLVDQLLKLTVVAGILLVLSAAALSNAAQAQTVERGPYLQMGAPTSMTIRWRTNVATDSVVRYGLSATDQPFTAQIAGNRTDHEVALTGLNPATSYFYSVGNSTQPLAGGDADHMFVTSPPVGTAQPTRIWVVGDSGTKDSGARQVRDAYLNSPNLPYTNLFLMLGDNAYENGSDSNYQHAVFNMYPTVLRQTPVWPTFGNHDGTDSNSNGESGPYYDIFTLPRVGEIGGAPSGTEAYYSFDYGNIHFIVMDSFETDRSEDSAMIRWLRDDLLAHNQPWVIAFWHHPPYSHGSHNTDNSGEIQSREMREIALPILEEGGVDLVLSGHSHSYERSFLIDGHYGHSNTFVPANHLIDGGDGRVDGDGAYSKPGDFVADPHQGAVFAVAGSSGKVSPRTLDHPVMAVNFNLLGSMVLDVNGDTLDAVFLDNNGVERDKFRIVKTPSLPQVNVVASDPTASEAGPTGGLFAVTRTGDTASALTVSYAVSGTATAGTDYTALSGNVVIAAGQQTATIDVGTIDDGLVESDETVIVTLTAAADYIIAAQSGGQASVNIVSDEVIPTVQISASVPVAEEAGPTSGAFTITRSGYLGDVTTVDYTVSGAATAGDDYSALSGSVHMGIGVATVDIVVSPLPDAVADDGETVIATLSNRPLYTIAAPNSATVTILDAPPAAPTLTSIAISFAAASVELGQSLPFTAMGTYSDDSTGDVTNSVTWSSSSPSIATISISISVGLPNLLFSYGDPVSDPIEPTSANGIQAQAHGLLLGTTTITASQDGITSNEAVLTVKALTSIAISPAITSLEVGQSQTFTATGTFTDNSTSDLTNSVTWSSSDPSVAIINILVTLDWSNGVPIIGAVTAQAFGLLPGTTTITATRGSITSNATESTVTAPPAPLSIVNSTASTPNTIASDGPAAPKADTFGVSVANGAGTVRGIGRTQVRQPTTTSRSVGGRGKTVTNRSTVESSRVVNQAPPVNSASDQLLDATGNGATLLTTVENPIVTQAAGTQAVDLMATADSNAMSTGTEMTTEQAAPPAGPDFKTQIVRIVIPSGASTVVTSAFDAVDSSRTVAVISGIMQHAMMDQEAQDPAEISARVELSTNGAILIATRSSSEVPASTVSVLLIENTAIPSDASEAVVRDHRVIPLSAGQTSPTYDPVGSVNDGNKIVMFDAESIWRAVKQRQQGFKRPR